MKVPETLKWKATGRTLGTGGQGEVYEVTNKGEESGQRYALKVLRKGRPKSAYDRFYREIATIKDIDHPNIITVIDHSEPGGEFDYYVMELLEGARPLSKLLGSADNPYYQDVTRSLELFKQIVSVVNLCERRIVHRDLSPSNIMILPDGSIKIIDFGLCQIEGADRITLIDEDVGTVNYRAPECESGARGKIDSRADLYSAGKILWSAITSNRAFARESPVFTTHSMNSIFPDRPNTWHLNVVFERTIRRSAEDRESAHRLLWFADLLINAVKAGRPPLESIIKRCPLCGLGDLESDGQTGRMLFANPPPKGIVYFQCNYCGYCFAVNTDKILETLRKRPTLE